jgi:predicted amidohydrolase
VEAEDGRYYNVCHVFDQGRHAGFYRKVHPTDREKEDGISPGARFQMLEIRGLRLGLMVCADVLFPQSFRQMAALKPDLIAVPTISPYQPDDTVDKKYRRDQELFVAGARAAGAFILKACGIGSIFGHRLQGRSLICSPFGVITRINPRAEHQEEVLTAEINLDQLKLVVPPRSHGNRHHRQGKRG